MIFYKHIIYCFCMIAYISKFIYFIFIFWILEILCNYLSKNKDIKTSLLNYTTSGLIKLTNIGSEIIKLHWKFSPNFVCLKSVNNFFVRSKLLLEFKPCFVVLMHVNNFKLKECSNIIKRIFAILLSKQSWFKKYLEASMLESMFITFTFVKNSFKLLQPKTISSANN